MPRSSSAGTGVSTIQLLHLAASKADRIFEEHVGSIEITAREYEVLAAVARHNGLSQTDIMNDTGIDRSTTAQLTTRLVRRGWLQRRRAKHDRRTYRVRLTEHGKAALAKAGPASLATEKVLLASLAPSQKADLLEALKRIV